MLKPNAAERVERQLSKQVQQHKARAQDRTFETGEQVFVRNYQRGERWVPGVIQAATGPVSFGVRMQDGRTRRCHQDQVRTRSVDVPPVVATEALEIPVKETSSNEPPVTSQSSESSVPESVEPPVPPQTVEPSQPATSVKVYPKRSRKTVDRYDPSQS